MKFENTSQEYPLIVSGIYYVKNGQHSHINTWGHKQHLNIPVWATGCNDNGQAIAEQQSSAAEVHDSDREIGILGFSQGHDISVSRWTFDISVIIMTYTCTCITNDSVASLWRFESRQRWNHFWQHRFSFRFTSSNSSVPIWNWGTCEDVRSMDARFNELDTYKYKILHVNTAWNDRLLGWLGFAHNTSKSTAKQRHDAVIFVHFDSYRPFV